jgi:hypothetical protein
MEKDIYWNNFLLIPNYGCWKQKWNSKKRIFLWSIRLNKNCHLSFSVSICLRPNLLEVQTLTALHCKSRYKWSCSSTQHHVANSNTQINHSLTIHYATVCWYIFPHGFCIYSFQELKHKVNKSGDKTDHKVCCIT